jgi:hypothetical protein
LGCRRDAGGTECQHEKYKRSKSERAAHILTHFFWLGTWQHGRVCWGSVNISTACRCPSIGEKSRLHSLTQDRGSGPFSMSVIACLHQLGSPSFTISFMQNWFPASAITAAQFLKGAIAAIAFIAVYAYWHWLPRPHAF